MIARVLLLSALVLGGVAGPLACSGGVVGGECRRGYAPCGGKCISITDDPANCGACNNTCAEGQPCVDSVCGGGAGGGSADASAGGGGGRGGEASGGAGGADASVGGSAGTGGAGGAGGSGGVGGAGGARDGGPTDGSVSDVECIGPFTTSEQCGACGRQCREPSPYCELGESGYECVDDCTPPLVLCGTECVNLETDEQHCGSCPNRCPSGICQGGVCVGATAGHLVMSCMDYRQDTPPGSSQEQLLGNSVFLGTKNPVRVLAYEQYSRPANVTIVTRMLDRAATARGRSYALTAVTASLDVANSLDVTNYDVLLVYDQPRAPAGRLAAVGTSWAAAIDPFARAGGTVVVLAGPGAPGEMDELITGAGLLAVTGQTLVTGAEMHNRAPADAVGINVLTPFRASVDTCTFSTSVPADSATIFVIQDQPTGAGAPVVVHRVLVP